MTRRLPATAVFAGAGTLVLLAFAGALGPGSAASAQERLSLDVLAYCRQLYGASAGYYQVRSDAYSWACTLGARRFPINVPDICALQYGNEYTATVENPADSFTWGCVKKPAAAQK